MPEAIIPWHQNDDLFIKELRQGYAWQKFVGMYFELNGLQVQQESELKIRESIADTHHWTNIPDLVVNGHILEIKSRNLNFTSPQSYPFQTVMIETISGFAAKKPKPLAYIIVSRETGTMLFLGSGKKNREVWHTQSAFDRTRNIQDDWYMVGRSQLQTMDILLDLLKKNKK